MLTLEAVYSFLVIKVGKVSNKLSKSSSEVSDLSDTLDRDTSFGTSPLDTLELIEDSSSASYGSYDLTKLSLELTETSSSELSFH